MLLLLGNRIFELINDDDTDPWFAVQIEWRKRNITISDIFPLIFLRQLISMHITRIYYRCGLPLPAAAVVVVYHLQRARTHKSTHSKQQL